MLVLQNKIREQCYIVEISKAVHTSIHPSYVKSCHGSGRLTRVYVYTTGSPPSST